MLFHFPFGVLEIDLERVGQFVRVARDAAVFATKIAVEVDDHGVD
jgi:hypothetical protein